MLPFLPCPLSLQSRVHTLHINIQLQPAVIRENSTTSQHLKAEGGKSRAMKGTRSGDLFVQEAISLAPFLFPHCIPSSEERKGSIPLLSNDLQQTDSVDIEEITNPSQPRFRHPHREIESTSLSFGRLSSAHGRHIEIA